MTPLVRWHGPSIRSRLRAERGLLLLVAAVVAVTTVLASALGPLTERASDQAVAAAVRDAGERGTVVATLPDPVEDTLEPERDPEEARRFREQAASAAARLPERLAGVVQPGAASLTTPALHLLDAGPGRYLRLTYVDTPAGAPAVTWTAGGPPTPSELSGPVDGDPVVEVGLSGAAARALGLAPGDLLPTEDEQARAVSVRVSGTYEAVDPADAAWSVSAQLLRPALPSADGSGRTTASALVTAASLPDLRLAVPVDDLTARVGFVPVPARLTWRAAPALGREVTALQASAGRTQGEVSWDSRLAQVLDEARGEVAAARAQAQVLVVGLLVGSGLVLLLAAQLLVRRRLGSLALARARGASLPGIAAELLVESLAVGLAGAAVGLLTTRLVVGDVGWAPVVPVLLVAAAAAPLLGSWAAARSADVRQAPADRAARRVAARARALRRLLLEAVAVAAAVLSVVALHQRGVLGSSGGLTSYGAPTWVSLAGALLLVRAWPLLARGLLSRARRSTGAAPLVTAARWAETGSRAAALLVVAVVVAQLVVGVSLAATARQGQAAGALLDVGADARLVLAAPSAEAGSLVGEVGSAGGVRAAVAARVATGTRVTSRAGPRVVTLVVVDPRAWSRVLLADGRSAVPPLGSPPSGAAPDAVPVLLLGGDAALRDGMRVAWQDETDVALAVVGTAPRVGPVGDPVVVVAADDFRGAGASADPDTVWAAGPGAAAALRARAQPADTVEVASEVLAARRGEPLAAGLVRLAVASASLLLLLAVLAVVLVAAANAPARATSLGRLRALGLGDRPLRQVHVGELLVPTVVAALAGLVLGAAAVVACLGGLSLELVTGQDSTPDVVVPWWLGSVVAALALTSVVVAVAEAGRQRRTPLARLLRGG